MRCTQANIVFITLIVLTALAGCERTQDTAIDMMPLTETDTTPVRFVLFIDYPEGGKEAYIAAVADVAAILTAPEELVRLRSYDNADPDKSPHRLVEFDFKSYLDLATYLNRPDIAAILEDLPNNSPAATAHTFIQRSDYAQGDAGNWAVKDVYLIDYPFGGKQAYLDWVASVAELLADPPQPRTIVSYDNYYGSSPHRLVAFEFVSQADADAYVHIEDVMAVEAESKNRASSWVKYTFVLRSDYVNE